MLRYSKGAPPRCLTTLSATPNTSWDSVHGSQRDEIRVCLVRDQGSLCAYCQRRIRATGGTMKIEHWNARSHGGAHFQWTNLLGACDGVAPPGFDAFNTAKEPRYHCDTLRGNESLFLHPVVGQNHDPRTYLSYTSDGRITATDERATRDLGTLNLNAQHLCRGRKAALDALRQRLDRIGWQSGTLAAELKAIELRAGSAAPEHAEFLRYHLQRWLRKQPSNA